MKPYFIKTPLVLKKIFTKRLWDIQDVPNAVYLTFDDGPTPEVTPWVLEQLKKYDAKATFFCIGKNVKKHSDLFRQIIEAGHKIGNHTNNHMNGWQTPTAKYLKNIQKAETTIQVNWPKDKLDEFSRKKLFRPPYGKMKFSQAKEVLKKGYQIVMWDVLSADFDNSISPEKCTSNVLNNVANGSIIIFHDSLKAEKNLKHALPATLEFLKKKNLKSLTI